MLAMKIDGSSDMDEGGEIHSSSMIAVAVAEGENEEKLACMVCMAWLLK